MSLPTSPPIQLPAAGRQTQPWVNGQGVTMPVTCGSLGGPGVEPLWWINIACIPGDCEFSEMVGVERRFMPLDDVPLSLDLDGTRSVARFEVVDFAGEMAPRCSAAGPTRALNLMLRRGRAAGTLELLTVEGPVEQPVPRGGTVVVIKLDGDAVWSCGEELRPGDAVRQDAGPAHDGSGPGHVRLDGHGRVAIISVR